MLYFSVQRDRYWVYGIRSLLGVGVLCALFLLAAQASAQDVHQELQATWHARVDRVLEEGKHTIPGLDILTPFQRLEVTLLDGPRAGEELTIDNDRVQLRAGDRFFLDALITIEGATFFTVREPDRRLVLAVLGAVFVLAVLLFGGMQGMRALLSLAGAGLMVVYVLIPQLLSGASPLLVSFLVALSILAATLYLTHGINRESTSALIGTTLTIGLTLILAEVAVRTAKLTGFVDDTNTFLNLETGGTLNMQGLLLGAIIIGVIGVLDDIAITQASAVKELYATDPSLSKHTLYRKALHIGRAHVGAVVNTLVLAYTGAALPLLLLFSTSTTPLLLIINREIFATEIIRTIIGSIGIVLAVPLTTYIAVMLCAKKQHAVVQKNTLEKL